MSALLDLDFRIQTSESGFGADFLRRFRIWGQIFRIPESSDQNSGLVLDSFSLSLFVLFVFLGY